MNDKYVSEAHYRSLVRFTKLIIKARPTTAVGAAAVDTAAIM
jgi:hypothetical protein